MRKQMHRELPILPKVTQLESKGVSPNLGDQGKTTEVSAKPPSLPMVGATRSRRLRGKET